MILAVATSTVDLSPILNPLIEIAGLVLSGFAMWALQRVATHFGISTKSALFQAVLGATDRGIAYAQNVVEARADTATVDVKNAVAAEAANYVTSKMPEALNKLGMTEQHVADLVLARLPQDDPKPALPPAAVPQPNP